MQQENKTTENFHKPFGQVEVKKLRDKAAENRKFWAFLTGLQQKKECVIITKMPEKQTADSERAVVGGMRFEDNI